MLSSNKRTEGLASAGADRADHVFHGSTGGADRADQFMAVLMVSFLVAPTILMLNNRCGGHGSLHG